MLSQDSLIGCCCEGCPGASGVSMWARGSVGWDMSAAAWRRWLQLRPGASACFAARAAPAGTQVSTRLQSAAHYCTAASAMDAPPHLGNRCPAVSGSAGSVGLRSWHRGIVAWTRPARPATISSSPGCQNYGHAARAQNLNQTRTAAKCSAPRLQSAPTAKVTCVSISPSSEHLPERCRRGPGRDVAEMRASNAAVCRRHWGPTQQQAGSCREPGEFCVLSAFLQRHPPPCDSPFKNKVTLKRAMWLLPCCRQ